MKYIFHTSSNNERWDEIAFKYYGSSYEIKKIIEANPHIPITGELDEGLTVKIPIDEDEEDTVSSLLPMWKRQE